jgi:hypothetical protein
VTITPDEFMSAAPKSVSGSSPWAARYAADIRRAWLEFAAEDARTVQRHLGPSELGVECDRQVAGKLAELPPTNHVVDPWPSIRGKALHRHAEDVFNGDNLRRGLLRWITEQKVTPHPEHPGTADLYDALEQCVDDHKFLGESSMAKVRKGWPRHYLVQLLLYGLGYYLMGLPVKRVVLVAYPATAGSLDGLYVRETAFSGEDGKPLPEVLELIQSVFADTDRRKAQAAEITAGRMTLMQVPSAPDDDDCFFCPFYRPQSARDGGPGCPGARSSR